MLQSRPESAIKPRSVPFYLIIQPTSWFPDNSRYWLPKLHKKQYMARFIANSSSCTTTELSKLLTSCLTTIKNHVIKYCEKVYERSSKIFFWSIKNSCEVLNKLKSRGLRASVCLHTIFLHYILPCPTILLRIN